MNSTNVFVISMLTSVIGINIGISVLQSSSTIIQVACLVMAAGWMGFLFGAESKREFLFKFGNACFERGVASTRESA